MTAFNLLPAELRAFLTLWAFLLCFVNIISAVISAAGRRYRFSALALLIFVLPYLMWQLMFDFSLFGEGERAAGLSRLLCALPSALWILALLLITLASAVLLGFNIKHDRSFVNPGTIKLFLDRIPCGVCCFTSSGRVLLSNICMNELCEAISGSALLNGLQLSAAVRDEIISAKDKVWRFRSREFTLDGRSLHEIIASDISGEYAKTQALERDREELFRLNEELQQYYTGIDDSVRRQEILQAKVNIHDEMNRLMLSTMSVESGNKKAFNRILSLWENNALLLCMEAEQTEDAKEASDMDKLAEALKIRLVWQNDPLPLLSEAQRGLFLSAAKEAIINAKKHAEAKTLSISFSETGEGIFCRFANDGAIPESPVLFTGGLQNLSRAAAEQGATISTYFDKEFILSLYLPKKNQPIG